MFQLLDIPSEMWDNCCRRSGSTSDLSRDTIDAYSPINRSDSPLAQVRRIKLKKKKIVITIKYKSVLFIVCQRYRVVVYYII